MLYITQLLSSRDKQGSCDRRKRTPQTKRKAAKRWKLTPCLMSIMIHLKIAAPTNTNNITIALIFIYCIKLFMLLYSSSLFKLFSFSLFRWAFREWYSEPIGKEYFRTTSVWNSHRFVDDLKFLLFLFCGFNWSLSCKFRIFEGKFDA